jgi:hypothetical protein
VGCDATSVATEFMVSTEPPDQPSPFSSMTQFTSVEPPSTVQVHFDPLGPSVVARGGLLIGREENRDLQIAESRISGSLGGRCCQRKKNTAHDRYPVAKGGVLPEREEHRT